MSRSKRWFAEYGRHLEEQVEFGLDWDAAALYAAMLADEAEAERGALIADDLGDWLRDEAALNQLAQEV